MIPKIRYRLCYNYAGRLGRDGMAPVALECRQGAKKMYVSANVRIKPEQWRSGRVVNHDCGDKLTAYLVRWMHQVEEIEIDALLKGRRMSLLQLKSAIKCDVRSSASIAEFSASVINDSNRSRATKKSYETLTREIEHDSGRMTLDDITYDWIERWRNRMRGQQLSENTIKGRLKQLRCLMNEAVKRGLISDDPFRFVTIGNMTARVGYLEQREVRRLERLRLSGLEAGVRDMFLLSCYTGLRWSDISTLEEATITGGVLRKTMAKTRHDVFIPIDALFWGKAREIIDRYQPITSLSHLCCNTTANRVLKELAARAGIRKRIYFHLARKTCSAMLNSFGLPLQDISTILGHTKMEVTARHYVFNQSDRLQKSVGRIFQKSNRPPITSSPKKGEPTK